jgi:hypothetical protein
MVSYSMISSTHSNGSFIDPMQLKSYLCRGELYDLLHAETAKRQDEEMEDHKKQKRGRTVSCNFYLRQAIKDYSRAIHMYPATYLLYLYRGRLLLKQG